MIDFHNLLMLAPLAGYTDLPFRSLVKDFGADITVSEMISSHALVYNQQKTLKMAKKSPKETPFAVQISGSNIPIIQRAVSILNELEGIDIVDFNCGCPAPKVANHGNGSGLLKDLPLLVKILQCIADTTKTHYTSVKVRLGFDQKIPVEIANALLDSPVSYVVVHGRTKSDGYKKERIDYEAIAKMKSILKVPVIANGEIYSLEDAKRVLELTGADGLMIGRAAISNPWIFYQIKNNTHAIPPIIKKDLVLSHFDSMVEFYGLRGVVMFRKNLHAYAKGHIHSTQFRHYVNSVMDAKEMRERIEEFFSYNPDCLDETASPFLVDRPFPQLITLNQKSV